MRILIAAGGTGGHVYPGLAVADVLRARGHDVSFIGGDRAEAVLVPAAGYELHTMPARGLPRSEHARAMAGPTLRASVTVLRSMLAARRILKTIGTDVVVGMGGYVTTGPAWAAKVSGIPVVLHEQNAKLALGHRLSLWTAQVLALSIPLDGGQRRVRTEITGNPLREPIRELARCGPDDRAQRRTAARARWQLDPVKTTVLVFGGSLGARVLNEAIPRIASRWGRRADVQVLHISGVQHESDVRDAWASTHVAHAVEPYVTAMEDALACADLVIARGGATTVAELAALGLPSVLVPLPAGYGGYQEANARALERAGGAHVVVEGEGFEVRLQEALRSLVDDAERRASMSGKARALGAPDAADRLADVVESVIR